MNADAERGLRGPLAYAIHASFFVLLSTSGVRYVTVHGTSGRFGVVLVLAVVLALLYAVMATVSSRDVVRQRLWMWPVLSAWAALVWLAPSFAWCAFPVLFLCIRLYPSKIAYPLVGILGVLAGIAFYRVTGRAELVTLRAAVHRGTGRGRVRADGTRCPRTPSASASGSRSAICIGRYRTRCLRCR